MWLEETKLTMKDTIAPALFLILSFLSTFFLLVATKSRRRSTLLPLTPPKPPRPSSRPPGPPGWLIIGNIFHIIGKAPHRSLADLSRVYGPVMSLTLGRVTTVVISSPEAAKEVLRTFDHVFSAQNFSETARGIGQQDVSIPWIPSTSSHWSSWRKLLATQLFSRRYLEARSSLQYDKVKELLKFIDESSQRGEAVEIARACFITSLNVLSNLVFSTDLGHYDPRSSANLEFQDSLFSIMENIRKPNIANYFPSLEFLGLQGNKQKMTMCSERLFRAIQGLIYDRIVERSLPGPRGGFSVNLLDSLIDLVRDEKSEINMNNIKHFLYDLFIAGTQTNATTVEWALTELIRNPEAMANAKVEINSKVGPNRYIGDHHLADVPYLRAVVTETFRLHPPSPFLIPRKAESDTNIVGFLVPKNTQILVNAWAIGRDPSVWENAERFEPERFLGQELETIGGNFEMIPFGAGHKMCPGILLALRIVPHMLASLIYSFEWSPQNEKNYVVPEDLDMDETFGLPCTRPTHFIPTTSRKHKTIFLSTLS